MGRVLPSVVSLLLALCAARCDEDRSLNRVDRSDEPLSTTKIEASTLGTTGTSDANSPPVEAQQAPLVELAKAPQNGTFFATRTKCMRPCAVQFDAQQAEGLSWEQVRDSKFVWNFDDGGSTTDAEGFLAATVYESAGTYRPVVTVNGHAWKAKTITVTDPRQVACVSPAGDWTNCPKGAKRYGSISAAIARTGANSHILLEGNRNHGNLPSKGAKNILFGAYDTGSGNPEVSAPGVRAKTGWSYQDLTITASRTLFDGFRMGRNILWQRIDAPSGQTFLSAVFDTNGAFIFDSNLQGAGYTVFVGNAKCDRFVIKNSVLNSTKAGQHVARVQDCDRILVQGSTFKIPGRNTSLTVRGDSEWGLIQNNNANKEMTFSAENRSADTVRKWLVVERNYVVLPSPLPNVMRVRGTQNAIFRNNILQGHSSQTGIKAEGGQIQSNANLMLVNNTYYDPVPSDESAVCTCDGANCVAKNNLGVASPKFNTTSCVPGGGTISNNWCYTTSAKRWCRDPSGRGSTCQDPRLISTRYGDPNFMRPRALSGRFDLGDQAVPVWNDFFDAPRSRVDVGAVRAQQK